MTTVAERAERGAALPDEQKCEATWTLLGIEAPCGDPAVGLFRRACVHEHVRDGWLCREHAERRDGLCLTCHEMRGDMGHDCPIDLAEVTP